MVIFVILTNQKFSFEARWILFMGFLITSQRHYRTSALLLVIAFLSGAFSLIYEIVWTRMLTLLFGNTTYAVSTVLTVFMGGMALGSFIPTVRRYALTCERWGQC